MQFISESADDETERLSERQKAHVCVFDREKERKRKIEREREMESEREKGGER